MDTPNVARYYREQDPIKRTKLLKLIIQEEGDTEENLIRREIYKSRYQENSKANKDLPADGYLALWMSLEYNCQVGTGLFGFDVKRAQKEVRKHLEKLRIPEFMEKGGLYKELVQRELENMVRTYVLLSQTDKSYNSVLFGLMKMSAERSEQKLKEDIMRIVVLLPEKLHMEEEMAPITEAAKRVYDEFYPRDELDDIEI